MKPRWILALVLACGMSLCMTSVMLADDDDPPGRVARLSYMDGAVSMGPAGTDEWLDADPNRPITRGDRLWADQDSRAEFQIGSAAIRCADQTGFSFLDLTDDVVQIQLAEGAMSIQLRDLDEGEVFEIDTPNLAFTLQRPGDYRIEVSPEGDTTVVSVRRGLGEVTGGGRIYTVRSNQRASFMGTDDLDSYIDQVADYDDFDQWCHDRDMRHRNSISSRYVPRGVIGYEDLDEYGQWRTTAEFGAVWFPSRVSVGWTPYRDGHWAWIAPWGWTWIDDAPWGFAPFHYGRWAHVGGRWGWCPGPRASGGVVVRPVYAPALVAWIGSPSLSVGISFGGGSVGVGWFPLAPREVYVPPYRVSRTYVTNVNITNTVVNNVTVINAYENTRTSNVRYVNRTALTAVPRTTFVSSEPVARNVVRLDAAQVTRAQVTTNIGVVPQQNSVAPPSRRARVRPPMEQRERRVVARTTPPPATVPFAQQRDAIEANGGRPLTRREADRLEPQRRPAAPVKVERPAASAPVPVESVAKPESEAPQPPPRGNGRRGRPISRPPGKGTANERQTPPGAAREPGQPESTAPPSAVPENPNAPEANPSEPSDRPPRPDRPVHPPRRSPNAPPPQENPPEERAPGQRPESAPDVNEPEPRNAQEKSPREQRLEQAHQQEQQRLMQQQEQERRRLEQRQHEQESRGEPVPSQQQQVERQRLEQQQAQKRVELRKRQQQEKQKLQQEEGKQPKKGKKEPPPKS
jgi:hypothetical protein